MFSNKIYFKVTIIINLSILLQQKVKKNDIFDKHFLLGLGKHKVSTAPWGYVVLNRKCSFKIELRGALAVHLLVKGNVPSMFAFKNPEYCLI